MELLKALWAFLTAHLYETRTVIVRVEEHSPTKAFGMNAIGVKTLMVLGAYTIRTHKLTDRSWFKEPELLKPALDGLSGTLSSGSWLEVVAIDPNTVDPTGRSESGWYKPATELFGDRLPLGTFRTQERGV